MTKQLVIFLVGILIIAGCASTKPNASKNKEVYDEDLSYLRPQYEAPEALPAGEIEENTPEYYNSIDPSFDVTGDLNAVLDSIDVLRNDIRYIDGFAIQVYSGGSQEEAYLARGKIYSLIPEADPELKYDQVNFTVKVGKYYSRMEAQKLYSQLKKSFPKATIIREKIHIR